MPNYPRELLHGSGVRMTLEPSRLLVALRERLGRADVEARLAEIALILEDASEEKPRVPRPREEVVTHDLRLRRDMWGRGLAQVRTCYMHGWCCDFAESICRQPARTASPMQS